MDFNRYFSNDELNSQIDEWVEKYPKLVRLEIIGSSHEDRPLKLLIITNQSTGKDTEKSAVWIDANLHATEIAGTTTSMRLAYTLLSEYGNDPKITKLLDTSTYYILPRVNPDGAELAMADIPEFVRSGVRPFPWEDKLEGIHMQDADKDGRILQMRIEDPNGDWKVSSLDPRLMERRGPDEDDGTFYRVFPEGLIEDYDGYQIKLAPSHKGLDFNRNFPIDWRTHGEQRGAGPYPTSEPEIKAMVDFITSHPNINTAITYHTFSGVILRPPSSYSDDEMDANDLWVYKAIGKRGTELVGYPNVSVYQDFRYHPKEVISGVFDDWMYNHLGIFAFTVEQWDIVGRAGFEDRKFIEWMRDHPHEDDLKILQWADENIGEDAYINWYKFDHPQLGQVELGGWNRFFTWRNPPKHLMGEESERNVPFALALGYMLPHIEINTLQVNNIEKDTYTINLVVDNNGFLPTYTSSVGKKRNIRPVRVELELPDNVKVLNGKSRREVGHLEGRSNKIGQTFIIASPTDNRGRLEWTLQGPQGNEIKVSIISERAGTIHTEFTLE